MATSRQSDRGREGARAPRDSRRRDSVMPGVLPPLPDRAAGAFFCFRGPDPFVSILPHSPQLVTTGLDPVAHDAAPITGRFGWAKAAESPRAWRVIMGCRVKPGNDELGA